MAKVKNVEITSVFPNGCNKLLDFWIQHTHIIPTYCAELGCINRDIQGHTVQKINDNPIYIIPLCILHTKSSDILDIANTELVDASQVILTDII